MDSPVTPRKKATGTRAPLPSVKNSSHGLTRNRDTSRGVRLSLPSDFHLYQRALSLHGVQIGVPDEDENSTYPRYSTAPDSQGSQSLRDPKEVTFSDSRDAFSAGKTVARSGKRYAFRKTLHVPEIVTPSGNRYSFRKSLRVPEIIAPAFQEHTTSDTHTADTHTADTHAEGRARSMNEPAPPTNYAVLNCLTAAAHQHDGRIRHQMSTLPIQQPLT